MPRAQFERLPAPVARVLSGLPRAGDTEAKRIRLYQRNDKTGDRMAQQLVDSATGELVERDHIVRGYK